MITVIVGTNRPESNSQIVADSYSQILNDLGVENRQLALLDLPPDFVYADMYGKRREEMDAVIEKHISTVDKFVFIVPEYNGGFPGVLKAFLDCTPPAVWYGKKAGLIGISSGAAGSLRGMDQFSNVLNYLRVNVLYSKPKLSGIERILGEERVLDEERSLNLLQEHARLMEQF